MSYGEFADRNVRESERYLVDHGRGWLCFPLFQDSKLPKHLEWKDVNLLTTATINKRIYEEYPTHTYEYNVIRIHSAEGIETCAGLTS